MTQIAVFLNAPVTSNLRADNLGGEWRWERQVLEALLLSNRFDRVYSLRPVWQSDEPMPPRFIDGLPQKEEADTVCIMHDSYHVAEQHRFKGLVIQVHRPTHDCTSFVKTYKKKFFLTYDRVVMCADGTHENLVSVSSPTSVEMVANPSIPCVHDGDNFDKRIILFPAKGVVHALKTPAFYWGELFSWCAKKLAEDSEKELHFLTGYEQASLDFCGWKDVKEEFFSSPQTQPLRPFSDRVVLHMGLPWSAVLDLYSQTKVVVSSLATGGAPPEAASFGIPVIGHGGTTIKNFPEFLFAESLSSEYLALTDKLYYDRDFYVRVGAAYKEYVATHWTYEAYAANLMRIFDTREML